MALWQQVGAWRTAFALHLLYWHLPAFMTGLKRTPPSYLRELAG